MFGNLHTRVLFAALVIVALIAPVSACFAAAAAPAHHGCCHPMGKTAKAAQYGDCCAFSLPSSVPPQTQSAPAPNSGLVAGLVAPSVALALAAGPLPFERDQSPPGLTPPSRSILRI